MCLEYADQFRPNNKNNLGGWVGEGSLKLPSYEHENFLHFDNE